MEKKAASEVMLTLILLGMLTMAFNIQLVKATGTIYIRADGNVEGTDKIQRNGNVYTFIGDINETIAVQKDNIVIDGGGFSLVALASRVYGFELNGRSDVAIKNTLVKGFDHGIWLGVSSRNKIMGNNITGNYNGVFLTLFSSNNSITGNKIFKNYNGGIIIGSSTNNVVWDNNITGNYLGVDLFQSSANRFYRNNFIDNADQASLDEAGYANFWDNGVEGNYWSDYAGVDADHDGFGDTAYFIDDSNMDAHPHMLATETNLWQPEQSGFSIDPTILYALIVAVIATAAALAFFLLRRKKKPVVTPTASTSQTTYSI